MKKRIVSAFLVLTVLLTLAVVPVSASEIEYNAGNIDDFINDFTTRIFGFNSTQKQQLIDLMVLFEKLSMPDDFSQVYSDAMDQLLGGQGSEYKDGLKLSFELVREVSLFMHKDDFSPENVKSLLMGGDQEGFKAAFDLHNRKEKIKDVLVHNNVTVTNKTVEFGFQKMAKFFDLVYDLQNNSTFKKYLRIFEAKTYRGSLSLRTTIIEDLLDLSKVVTVIDVENPDEVIAAMQVLVNYYNSSAVDAGDNNLIYDYFDDNGFIYLDKDDDDDNGGGSTKPPVTPVTPPVIDDNEQELDDLLDDLINPEDPDQQVSEEELQEIIEEAVELAEKVVEQAGTADVGELAVTTDEKAAVDLSDLDLTAQIEVAQEAANKMKQALGAAGVEEEITTSITFTVPEIENVEEVEVTLPPLQEVFEKVDIVKVTSEVASFEIDKETFGEDSGNVTLSAARVDDAVVEELLAKQPEDNKIPADAVLIDLNAHVETTDSDTGETTTTKVSSFNKKITVSLPYQLAEGQDPEKVSVYLVKDDGTIVKVAGKYDEETGMIEFTRKTFSYYYVAPSTDTFTDLANYGWARQAIEVMAGKGVIGGRGNGIFDPGADITRAEFAALLTRLLQLEGDFAELTFTDVTADCWFRNDVAAAYQAGIINGRSATIFDPKANITRQEAAAMVTNALEYLGYDSEKSADMISDKFTDFDSIAPYALNSVATLYREEIIKDLYEGEFSPKMNTTRAETAMMLYKLFLGY